MAAATFSLPGHENVWDIVIVIDERDKVGIENSKKFTLACGILIIQSYQSCDFLLKWSFRRKLWQSVLDFLWPIKHIYNNTDIHNAILHICIAVGLVKEPIIDRGGNVKMLVSCMQKNQHDPLVLFKPVSLAKYFLQRALRLCEWRQGEVSGTQ